MTATAAPSSPFARRVTAVFSTKVVAFSMSLATTLIVSNILGADGKGTYVAVIAVPGLLGAIGVFGLPNAVSYFSARGASIRGLLVAGLIFTAVLSAFLVSLVWVTLPWLASAFHWDQSTAGLVRVVMITVPAGLLSTFAMTILYGRQQVRTYSAILIAQGISFFVLSVLLVAVFRFGVAGAVAASITVTWILALACVVAAIRLSRRIPEGKPASYRALIGYGTRLYPASLTGYFNNRVDVYIIQALMGPGKPLGLYSMAVTMAELIFYVPDSVTMIFLPRVTGATQAEADALLARVARLTVLITSLCALALIPVAWLGVNLLLSAAGFVPCLPAFLVLLPAVVFLSVAKVMTSYISGRGRPGIVSIGAAIALALNVAANFALIPHLGIVGAAASSLISYSALALMMLAVACRMSHHSPLTMIVPRMGEVRLLAAGVRRAAARVRQAASRRKAGAAPGGPS